MKLAIIGSRTISQDRKPQIRQALLALLEKYPIVLIVSGGALGADTIAEELAIELGIDRVIIKPEWDRYGKRAGPMRNTRIAGEADFCLAVLDKPLEKSKGTFDCVKKFRKLGKEVVLLHLLPD